MEKVKQRKAENEYKIIPIFKEQGKDFETVIVDAFVKYLKYNDYK